ncbi:hypothetical protein BGZ80_003750 [Entomortierella chlamydospora]|uniref:Uncharacterized protein n=1 Tax=Entomortierella chlamydospora TaxID=101097 RepID=A0A9P6SWR7_9FUNG|nr:hypothetical protein BGZ80_003750 [Entomortierella chlamydospora]
MDFPKINVSSKADIQYITQTWRKTLFDKLERQYGKNDPKRIQQVQHLLDQWLKNMIAMASSNIDINGIPYDQALINEDFEPLDESLGKRLQQQQLKVEELTLKVAERRKRVPEQVKMLLDDAIRRQSALCDRIEFEPDGAEEIEKEKARTEQELEKDCLLKYYPSGRSAGSRGRNPTLNPLS